MPNYWYSLRSCKTDFDKSICAQYKPYFMIYRYDKVKKEYKDYLTKNEINSLKRFGKTLEELLNSKELTEDESIFIEYYYKYLPICIQPSTMNRICWHIESAMDGYKIELKEKKISYNFLKYGCVCHKQTVARIKEMFQFYLDKLRRYRKDNKGNNVDLLKERSVFVKYIREELKEIKEQHEVFDALIDIADEKSMGKQFIWEVYGAEIVDRIEEVRQYANYE